MSAPIICLGAANIDAKAQALQPIVLGSSNPVKTTEQFGGVARNVCENLARLGCTTGLFAPLGTDAAAARIKAHLEQLGVNLTTFSQPLNLPTARYTALIDADGNLTAGMADMQIADAITTDHIDQQADFLARYPIWFADANLPEPVLSRINEARLPGTILAADGVSVAKASRLQGLLPNLDLLVCNIDEAMALRGKPIRAPLDVISTAHWLRDQGVGKVVISQGADGCYAASAGISTFFSALPISTIDVTGAGDALTAGILYGHSHAMPFETSVRLGLAAAALTCQTIQSVNPDLSSKTILSMIADAP
ncbi:MAG: carbohydrate kinase family protein [Pseudomonadota bacterium]